MGDQVSFTIGQFVAFLTAAGVFVTGAFYAGRLSHRVTTVEDGLLEVKKQIKEIYEYVRNGR